MDWTPIRTLCVFTIAIALVYLLCYFLFFRFARAELKKINVEWEENALLLSAVDTDVTLRLVAGE